MTWSDFIYFALPAILLWLVAGTTVYFKRLLRLSNIAMLAGIIIFFAFIVTFWIHIERPPLRTMGETRLWYSFFLAIVGYMAYRRWQYPWQIGRAHV